MSGCPLCEALVDLLPGTIVTRHVTLDWHSATFSGQRLVIMLQTDADVPAIADFARTIGDHEFTLKDLLVADIALTARSGNPDRSTLLTVEALLLDEEI